MGAIRDTKRATIMSNTIGYERRITGRVRLGFGLTVPAVVNFDKAFNPVAVPLPMPSLRGGIDLVHGFALGARVMTPMRVDSNGDGTYDSPLLFPWHLMVDYRIPQTPVSLSIGFHGLLNDRHFAAQKLPLAASIGTAWSF